MTKRKRVCEGYICKDWSFEIGKNGNLYINRMGIGLVSKDYRDTNKAWEELYPIKVRITIEEIK